MSSIDVLGAVCRFCDEYLKPKPATIVRGWQNRAALPPSSTLIVLTLLDTKRHGSNAYRWENAKNSAMVDTTLSMLTEYNVQVDICGLDEETVNAQAALLSLLWQSPVAVDFLKPFRLQAYYADDIKALPFSSEFNQWVVRYSVTLHLGGWTQYTLKQDAFSGVNARIENVDVHHKPTE